MDVRVDILNQEEAIEICKRYLLGDKYRSLYFINAHCYNVSKIDDVYRKSLIKSDLVLNDGIGMKIGLRLFNIKEKENMNGTDFIPKLLEAAIGLGSKIYLLGSKEEVIKEVEVKLRNKFPKCNIVGYHSGYFDNDEEIVNDINKSKAELLIVGMGVPLQEKWLYLNSQKLSNVKLSVAGGAIFDFMSNKVRRAPKIIRKLKMEWIFRLLLEPKRLWRRYLIGNFKFVYYIVKGRIRIN